MNTKECVAMILAGGRGERLGTLTRYYSKPAVYFGGNHRIIDFTLNNCLESGIDTIGILSQYLADDLHMYIMSVNKPRSSDIFMLSAKSNHDFYKGTADAVRKNYEFIERFAPKNVLVLSGDHIYHMDYTDMLDFHRKMDASITIASTPVPINEAPRFGIINAEPCGRVYGFEEKPIRPKSCLASMGVYIFKWSVLKRYLMMDSVGGSIRNDFGRDIVPKMLCMSEPMYTYQFNGYWRDVGTVDSLWEANMDQISQQPDFHLPDKGEKSISYTSDTVGSPAHKTGVCQSIISEGCSIVGRVEHSVLSTNVTVDKGAEIVDSVIMPGAYIGCNAKVYRAVVGTNAMVMDHTVIGADHGLDFFIDRKVCARGISLVAPWLHIGENLSFQAGSHIYEERLHEWANSDKGVVKLDHQPMETGLNKCSICHLLPFCHYSKEDVTYDACLPRIACGTKGDSYSY